MLGQKLDIDFSSDKTSPKNLNQNIIAWCKAIKFINYTALKFFSMNTEKLVRINNSYTETKL